MSSLAELRGGLVDTLAAAFPGFTVGRSVAVAPCIVVGWPDMDPVRATFGAQGHWGSPEEPGLVFPVMVWLSSGVAEDAQLALELLLNDSGAESIAEAVEASGAPILTVAESVTWESSRILAAEETKDVVLVGGEVSVRVIARRG